MCTLKKINIPWFTKLSIEPYQTYSWQDFKGRYLNEEYHIKYMQLMLIMLTFIFRFLIYLPQVLNYNYRHKHFHLSASSPEKALITAGIQHRPVQYALIARKIPVNASSEENVQTAHERYNGRSTLENATLRWG